MRLCQLYFLIWIILFNPALSVSQDSDTNWRLERNALEQQLLNDLKVEFDKFQSQGDQAATQAIRDSFQRRDLNRQYIFVPSEGKSPEPNTAAETAIAKANVAHAERVFELAKKAASSGGGAAAFQFLHEVLVLNPDHEQVRGILGHRKTDDGWRISSDRIKSRKATKSNDLLGWRKGEYLRVSTPHFEIASVANEEATIALARDLERWHDIWRQVFFEFWTSSKTVERWISGKGKARDSTRRYQVFFFPDKQSYVDELSSKIPGIEASSGYYSEQAKASFFFDGEQETWRHELTHQLFQEAIRSTQGPFQDGFVWLGEGIAMYFESMVEFENYVTLGGFDARRLQYSRIRLLRERFYVPLGQASDMGLQAFQTNQDVRRLYSQSAGMSHFFMNAEQGKHQEKLIEFLKLMYTGKLKPGTFQKIVGFDDESFGKQYVQYLRTDNSQIENHLLDPDARTEFSLGNPELSNDALSSIARCNNLTLLDLTDNVITAERVDLLSDLGNLQDLFLSNCKIQDGALSRLAKFDRLVEVDLAASDCTDRQFLELVNCRNLRIVTVTATGISDAAISELKQKISGLEVRK